jgi:MYXO-CTERM domain-containing protein
MMRAKRALGVGIGVLAASVAHAQVVPLEPAFASLSFTADQRGMRLPAVFGERHQNQPFAVHGVLVAGGNGLHPVVDLRDPYAPRVLSTLDSPHRSGEAESHQLSARIDADGTVVLATISGLGVDLWDLTDPADPALLATVDLEGVQYGDNTEAVWGIAFDGDALFVGGTSTGLHVLDVSDPTAPIVRARLSQAELGGVSAGPLYAVGDVLVVTTPKDRQGVATLDIRDPWAPALLDAVVPDTKSYIGAFYGRHAWLLTPLRAYDVLTDPANITLVSATPTEPAEYVSFADGLMLMGRLRPEPGVTLLDVTDPAAPVEVGRLSGRSQAPDFGRFTDDQFSQPLGNLVVLCDDEITGGCTLVVRDPQPDVQPPELLEVFPQDGAVGVDPGARLSLSLSEPIDTRTVGALTLRPLGGEPVRGAFSFTGTVLGFDPDEPLLPDTTYEVTVAPSLWDLVGNPLATTERWTFATGEALVSLPCEVGVLPPRAVGEEAPLTPAAAPNGAEASWSLGDGRSAEGAAPAVRWDAPGRYNVRLTVRDGAASRTCSGVAVVHRPLPEGTPAASATLAVDAARGRVWVVNADSDTVAEIDLATRARVQEHDAGRSPRTVAVDAAGGVWVTSQADDTVRVLGDDPATVALPWGCRPYGVLVDGAADGEAAWVSCEGSGEVHRIDVARRAVTTTVALYDDPWGPRPPLRGLALTPGGETLLVTRFLSSADEGQVFAIDAATGAPTEPWALAFDPGPDDHFGSRGVPGLISGVAVSPDGVRVAVPSSKANVDRGAFRSGEPLGADSTVRTIVSFLDLETGAEDLAARLDLDDQDSATAAAWSPRGDLVFVASQGSNRVEVYDAVRGGKVAGFATGLGPQGIALHDGVLWVHEALQNTLTAVDVSGLLQSGDGAAARLGTVELTERDLLSPEARLGKQIFTNANAREMTADGYISCASCHPDGGHDGQTWDFTDRGEGLRNTTDLRGKSGTGHGRIHWSGNFDEVQDFEHDLRDAFGGTGLMSDEDFLAEGRDDPLGTPKTGVSPRLDALAAYVATLDTFPRSPYRQPDGALHPDAEAGGRLFGRLGCEACHSGSTLTDSATGARHDVGTLGDGSGQRLGDTLDGLDTPTLLGLHASAPYLHDGSAPTLQDVLDNPEHIGRKLSAKQRDQLAFYLLSLEGEPVTVDGGCGCATSSRGGWPLALVALLWRRRRRA